MTTPVEFIKQVDETHEVTIQLPDDFPRGAVKITVESLSAQNTEDISWEDRPWTEEEIRAFLTFEPKSGAEIVAEGLVGGWEDMGITDSVAWVEEQRRKRQEQFKW